VFTPIRSFPDNVEAIAPPLPPLLLRDQLLGCQKKERKREAPFFILILSYSRYSFVLKLNK